MKRPPGSVYVCLLMFLYPFYSKGQEKTGYWQQRVEYALTVRLNDSDNTLDGTLKLTYYNNSPDTLRFIWFHLWPNAYKNDRTAFSEQLLRDGRTDFYFSDPAERGYINKLDFKVDGMPATTQDHPQLLDAVKLVLNDPLLPGKRVQITTPFHVKLPKQFSRSGYNGRGYSITQWYPKPAVYDAAGWHVMPYLERGEYYAEFGAYDVQIEIPQDYVVASTGRLLNASELSWLKQGAPGIRQQLELQGGERKMQPRNNAGKHLPEKTLPPSAPYKTLHYTQDSIHDFAWFASREFKVSHSVAALSSGKQIDVFAFCYPEWEKAWSAATAYASSALQFRSDQLSEYPYSTVSVVQGLDKSTGGMEYPMITLINARDSGQILDFIIEHEIGHNWFQGILASNERDYPWLDEGLNTFYDRKYFYRKYGNRYPMLVGQHSGLFHKFPADADTWFMKVLQSIHAGQPVNTGSEQLTAVNYMVVPYIKAAHWLETLEKQIGPDSLNMAMKRYVQDWSFRHPQPANFKSVMQESNPSATPAFTLLDSDPPFRPERKSVKPTLLFNFRNTDSIHYIGFLPVPGFNRYDKFMIGMFVHNYNLPVTRFRFFAIPFFATGSKAFNYLSHLEYTKRFSRWDEKLVFGLDLQSFSKNLSLDSSGNKIYERYGKIAPAITYQLPSFPGSSLQRWIQLKTFLLKERDFSGIGFHPEDSLFANPFVRSVRSTTTYINQLSFALNHHRALYPSDWLFQVQQGKGFYRLNATGHYFFNYKKSGGLSLRLFAAKFGYLNSRYKNDPTLYRYQPKLLGITGEEDFTYSNYFTGRTASYANPDGRYPNKGWPAQQIMIRDGGFKMRLDYFDFLQGRSDDWVGAINLNTTLPSGLFPVNLPLKLFLDIGTAAASWKPDYEGARFLYVGGIQLSLFRSVVNVYAPIIYSRDIRDNLQTVPELNSFAKRLTFSIDIHRISLRRYSYNQIPF